MSQSIKLICDSRIDNVPLLGLAVSAICSHASQDESLLYQLEVCVVEAVNNVIIHSYDRKPGYEIEVIITLNQDFFEFQIIDSGQKLSAKFDSITKSEFYFADLNALRESGNGLLIINSFMDEVTYNQQAGKNITTMRKKRLH